MPRSCARPTAPILVLASLSLLLAACDQTALPEQAGYGPNPQLPEPNPSWIPVMDIAPAVGWPEDRTPRPADGLQVTAFAKGLDHPRWLYELPNGDILVAESNAPPKPEGKEGGIKAWIKGLVMAEAGARVPSADRITLLRDADGDGVAETRAAFLENLTSPFGMALVGDTFYVANADALMRFPYEPGTTQITAPGEKVADLPAGRNHHWTKSLVAGPDGAKLYVGVGSNSNVAENGMAEEENRAAILEIDAASGDTRIYAGGLRNPVGMDFNPATGQLWVAVNERDEIGNDLVPDYMTSVQEGGFYGWPYSYFGQHVDTRVEPPAPDLVAKAIKPDYALGAHTASLGLTFVDEGRFAPAYAGGVIVGQHGSWNRDPPSGYRVIFVPFVDGAPSGMPQDLLTGFVNSEGEAMGRPVGVLTDSRGGLLVADDVGNVVWRVRADTQAATVSSPGSTAR
ncbi:PQQ-dependent sugar dehydrogenase [Aquabacter spiritensis]|uniref:Glucose/arabinose dehydrogenase n=1 Tax=Aquabacter spiritensis TaxID=933073 RepID=A0A4R3LWW4_9HYPH|nr:sorbosone dehydrogenase family protein [Aquabacter spiritensis]TCT04279.1 glucose/arabinose dehydrogenase [Aquabacter spiritensis]